MIGLDTNVLLRYLVKDHKDQGAFAAHLIKSGEVFFINHIVLCELVWVLESNYNTTKKMIIATLEDLLATEQFIIEQSEIIYKALDHYQNSSADFSDCLIGLTNKMQECEYTATFDKGTKSLPTFKVLK